ncbi:hypothetical protein FFK22_032235 [Mycobacterium sp. KBS0706]|uniref:hypothetical protein n=1 Tax=Mycobacterium sp. KBS0706 TaxID=2578109 RepID=UPI00110FF43F|nr:hypothetical protein [Mycobacterium sp. KBS0706]TSD84535.1 hypothetical protein FFK22_032235 [Mycobacterium sp. KBS0706]
MMRLFELEQQGGFVDLGDLVDRPLDQVGFGEGEDPPAFAGDLGAEEALDRSILYLGMELQFSILD